MDPTHIRALTFDVFGTLTDWRSSVAREVRVFAEHRGLELDAEAFATAWRAGYGPAMRRVEAGELPRQTVDELHRSILGELVDRFGIGGVGAASLDGLNLAWHRLVPWLDVRPGLERLRGRYLLAPFSNGNVALLEDLSARAGLEWDAILSAETIGHFKPHPEAYRGAARRLGLEPGQMLMVAAHNGDLDGAREQGFRTAFVLRPTEYGPEQATDLQPGPEVDLALGGIEELAEALAPRSGQARI